MIGSRCLRARALLAIGLSMAPVMALPATGCAFAVEHPAVTAGAVGGTLGFATCKLASDSYGACAAVGGGAGAFLALVAATALWLGGDGHTVLIDEQAQPLPEDSRPVRRRARPPGSPAEPATLPAEPSTAPPGPSPSSAPSSSPSSPSGPPPAPAAPAAPLPPPPAAPPAPARP